MGHHGEECSFDAIIHKYGLKDAALLEVAKVVRGADTKNSDLTPESPGLNSIAEGSKIMTKDDYENMSKQWPVYDALYAFFKAKVT